MAVKRPVAIITNNYKYSRREHIGCITLLCIKTTNWTWFKRIIQKQISLDRFNKHVVRIKWFYGFSTHELLYFYVCERNTMTTMEGLSWNYSLYGPTMYVKETLWKVYPEIILCTDRLKSLFLNVTCLGKKQTYFVVFRQNKIFFNPPICTYPTYYLFPIHVYLCCIRIARDETW